MAPRGRKVTKNQPLRRSKRIKHEEPEPEPASLEYTPPDEEEVETPSSPEYTPSSPAYCPPEEEEEVERPASTKYEPSEPSYCPPDDDEVERPASPEYTPSSPAYSPPDEDEEVERPASPKYEPSEPSYCPPEEDACPKNDDELQAVILDFCNKFPHVKISKDDLMKEVVERDLNWFNVLVKNKENLGKGNASILNRNIHKLLKAGKLKRENEGKNPPVYSVCMS
jgi:hypothetical protein